MSKTLLIYNAILLDEAIDSPGAILCVEGRIRAVYQGYFTDSKTVMELAKSVLREDGFTGDEPIELFDAKGLTVTPSFIDMHVHLRDPGFTQKEDLESGLKAAVAGGYGTVVAMPNTNPVVSTGEQAREVRQRAASLGLANMFQVCSITRDFEGVDVTHLFEINPDEVPVISEDGKEVSSSSVMLTAMKIAASKGMVVACHCEDPELAAAARIYRKEALKYMEKYGIPNWSDLDNFKDVSEEDLGLIERNLAMANDLLALAEDLATERNINIARKVSCHIHLCHVSTAQSVEYIKNAKQIVADKDAEFFEDLPDNDIEGMLGSAELDTDLPSQKGFSVTCEVTPHHIALCGTDEPEIFELVNPPLRPEEDRLALLAAIRDGTVDCIGTDHAPHTLQDKVGGAPGFSGIETSYGVCNSVLVKSGQISSKRLSQLMSANPARILKVQKGLLNVGYDADITVVDPDENWTVKSKLFYSKGKASPFEGKELTGKVKAVFIAGRKIFES